MNRDALGPVVVAVLAVVALGVGASTLDSIESGGSGIGVSESDDTGPAGGQGFDLGQPSPSDDGDLSPVSPLIRRVILALLVAGLLVGLYAWRNDLRRFAAMTAFAALAMGVLYYVITQLDSQNRQSGTGGVLGDQQFSIPGSEGARTVVTDWPVLAVLVGIVLVVGVVVVLQSDRIGGESATDDEPTAEASETDSTADVGRAAGRAADRIAADGETGNEIYRAWEEMTDHLDVANPGTSTPREFARAATDAGMARGDVDELTDLFRTVRYGGTRVTDDRESRAVTALRRIEREYAEEP